MITFCRAKGENSSQAGHTASADGAEGGDAAAAPAKRNNLLVTYAEYRFVFTREREMMCLRVITAGENHLDITARF